MGTEIPTKTNSAELDDDLPLAQRLILLQKKRAAELARLQTVVPAASSPNAVDVKRVRKSETVKIKKDLGVATAPINNKKDVMAKRMVKIKRDPGADNIVPKVKKIKVDPGAIVEKKKKLNGSEIDEQDQENQEYRWWEEQDNDGTIKWNSLEHNGVYFPPPYVPHGVRMLYKGEPVDLEPEAEEVATFFAAILGTDHYENETFRRNFIEDFTAHLEQIGSKWHGKITNLKDCDFTPISEHLQKLKEQRKSLTKEERELLKAEKAKIDEHYGICLLDGRKEKVGNFRMEPPGLFRGRGKHPKAGKLKHRVRPEQVTINIGPDAKVPTPPEGTCWGRVINDNTVTWLATWTENVNRQQKYVFLAAGSSLKGQSDLKKFETARELKKHVSKIRKVNAEELMSKEMFVRQRATALWLIDRLALRAGNEKGDDEADTVGCCSLRLEHVRLQEPTTVIFDFLGKDSIRYYNEVPVDPIIFKNLSIFMRPPKVSTDPIFDRLTTSGLNKYLNGLMPGLTAKVFRTFNASHTFQIELDKTPREGTIPELVLSYNRANRQVAILCNHQRTIPKTHQQSMAKLSEKILSMKYQRHLLCKELKDTLGIKELKAQLPAALEPESDMDEDTIRSKQEEAAELINGKDSPSPSKRSSSAEVLIKRFHNLTARIEAAKNQQIDRDENKTTALGTSKTNYIDPRITAAWCQEHNVPIEKLFTKTLREKFKWAMTVDAKWKF